MPKRPKLPIDILRKVRIIDLGQPLRNELYSYCDGLDDDIYPESTKLVKGKYKTLLVFGKMIKRMKPRTKDARKGKKILIAVAELIQGDNHQSHNSQTTIVKEDHNDSQERREAKFGNFKENVKEKFNDFKTNIEIKQKIKTLQEMIDEKTVSLIDNLTRKYSDQLKLNQSKILEIKLKLLTLYVGSVEHDIDSQYIFSDDFTKITDLITNENHLSKFIDLGINCIEHNIDPHIITNDRFTDIEFIITNKDGEGMREPVTELEINKTNIMPHGDFKKINLKKIDIKQEIDQIDKTLKQQLSKKEHILFNEMFTELSNNSKWNELQQLEAKKQSYALNIECKNKNIKFNDVLIGLNTLGTIVKSKVTAHDDIINYGRELIKFNIECNIGEKVEEPNSRYHNALQVISTLIKSPEDILKYGKPLLELDILSNAHGFKSKDLMSPTFNKMSNLITDETMFQAIVSFGKRCAIKDIDPKIIYNGISTICNNNLDTPMIATPISVIKYGYGLVKLYKNLVNNNMNPNDTIETSLPKFQKMIKNEKWFDNIMELCDNCIKNGIEPNLILDRLPNINNIYNDSDNITRYGSALIYAHKNMINNKINPALFFKNLFIINKRDNLLPEEIIQSSNEIINLHEVCADHNTKPYQILQHCLMESASIMTSQHKFKKIIKLSIDCIYNEIDPIYVFKQGLRKLKLNHLENSQFNKIMKLYTISINNEFDPSKILIDIFGKTTHLTAEEFDKRCDVATNKIKHQIKILNTYDKKIKKEFTELIAHDLGFNHLTIKKTIKNEIAILTKQLANDHLEISKVSKTRKITPGDYYNEMINNMEIDQITKLENNVSITPNNFQTFINQSITEIKKNKQSLTETQLRYLTVKNMISNNKHSNSNYLAATIPLKYADIETGITEAFKIGNELTELAKELGDPTIIFLYRDSFLSEIALNLTSQNIETKGILFSRNAFLINELKAYHLLSLFNKESFALATKDNRLIKVKTEEEEKIIVHEQTRKHYTTKIYSEIQTNPLFKELVVNHISMLKSEKTVKTNDDGMLIQQKLLIFDTGYETIPPYLTAIIEFAAEYEMETGKPFGTINQVKTKGRTINFSNLKLNGTQKLINCQYIFYISLKPYPYIGGELGKGNNSNVLMENVCGNSSTLSKYWQYDNIERQFYEDKALSDKDKIYDSKKPYDPNENLRQSRMNHALLKEMMKMKLLNGSIEVKT